jgi:glutaconate CoA-transferase subunit B
MYRVVTDLGLFGFDEQTKRMKVLALHPGVTLEQVRDNTGFELAVDSKLDVSEPPRPGELAFLRKLDPERLYTAS